MVSPNHILHGTNCPNCAKKNRRKTHEEFCNDLFLLNDSIELLSEYLGAKEKINYKCKICGYEWKTQATHLLEGHGCRKCATKINSLKQRKTHDEFIKELQQCNTTIIPLEEYKGIDTKIKFKCLLCEYEWKTIPYITLNGCGCPKCVGKYKTTEEFKSEIYTVNPYIEILGEYINSNSPIECKCKICNYIWNPISIYLKSSGCPICNLSHGERKIMSILDEENIFYIRQKSFINLKGLGGRPLTYDFYIPQCNLLIEFQGKQHESPIRHFGGEKQFSTQQEHDKRKRKYAQQNNINLLEIWYYEIDNIKSILLQKITEITENNLN